ncbi:MAG: myxosortase-dependent M36 family metallopeptidase [Myxococcaceae bacterium]|nr:myxosortase-dependent M36 family metallopeptidase [Myxococcaceae bacterium]
MRLKEKLLTSLLLMPLAGTSAWAKERANFDAFLVSQEAKSLPATDGDLQVRGARVEFIEERLGVPTVLWNARHDTERTSSMATLRPDQAARTHLKRFADLYRLTREDISSASLQFVHKTERGPVVARFGQKIEGIEIFRSGVNVAMDQDNNLVAITGYLAPHDAVAARRSTVGTDFRLAAADAVARAFTDLTDTAISGRSLVGTGSKGDFAQFAFEPGVGTVMPHAMSAPARARQVYFTLPSGLEPAWYVELNVGTKGSDDSDSYSYVVSAKDGSLLFRNNLTVEDSFTYRVWADTTSFIPFDGPHGADATPHPTGTPDRYQAPFIPPNLITLQNFPFSRNDPWLPANATQTTGNNVDAYADLVAPDGFQPGGMDLRANTTAPGAFDYTYDVTKAPGSSVDQRKAAVAHLFYLNNYLHDAYYDSGFDELAGNAQASNYGRGGIEGDAIKAEAQDYGGRNNANMTTPADGARPRMQMYVFNGVPNMLTTEPANIAGGFTVGTGAFGSSDYNIDGELQILDPNGATYACAPFPPDTFNGKIAVVDRGPLPPGAACSFTAKALNAQQAGAIAVIIANHTAGQGAPGMAGADPAITVPVVSTTKETADAWKAAVAAGSTVKVRMHRSPDLDRDGTIDNAIVAHEWGHYISNRLIGNANGLINSQGRAMGEGWADFHAMLMMVRDEDRTKPGNDQFQGVYAIAGYTQSGGTNNGHYFGIRRVPYSTDMTKNGLTYKHISNGNALPNHPVSGGASGLGNSQVHNSGEVWSTMLWECYASLLNVYPFQEAQRRMKAYLVAGYKLTPNSPTILEARDALLAAVAAAAPADYTRFAQAFAKRGAGFGAKGPDRESADNVGVVESYVAGNNLEVVSIRLDDSVTGCDRDGVLDVGETGTLSVTVRNNGVGALPASTATVAASGASATIAFPNGNTLNLPALQRNATATATLRVQLTAANAPASAGLTITFDEPSLPASAKTAIYDGRVHYDAMLSGATSDSFEGELSSWTSSFIGSRPGWQPETEKNPDGTSSRYLHVPDLSVLSEVALTSPWMKVSETGEFVMTFKYRHSLEGTVSTAGMVGPFYDGVVLEFSVDGIEWYNAFDLGQDPGYTAFLATGDNPLSDLPAYAGMSTGFPGWSTATVNLGQMVAGESLRVRFRMGTDSAVGAYGFDLDDVQFTSLSDAPFSTLAVEESNGLTCNRRPVGDVGVSSRTVSEFDDTMARTLVVLNGSASFDPDGEPLTYEWTQVAGPAITLTDATTATPSFTADVTANTLYTFQLVVKDASDSSLPKQAQVAVLNVNRKPVATVSAPATVAERTPGVITLDASASSDEDGEPLVYDWIQVDGPPVELSSASGPTTTFPVPEVIADTQFTFQVVASDGIAPSDPKTLSVTVTNVDRAPIADAGADLEGLSRESVTIRGSATDPDEDAVTYAWTQLEGPEVTLADGDTATPVFTAPDVKEDTVLRFQLVASAKGLSSDPDTVSVTLKKNNRHPVGRGPAAFEANEGTAVTFDATQSSDPDEDALTFQWVQTGGPLVQVTGENSATLQFTTPEVNADTLVTFNLTVKDTDAAESVVPVTVKVLNVNKAPTALARKVSGSVSGETITLDALGSKDPDGDALSYKWEQTAGPQVSLSSTAEATVTFQAPETEANAQLSFKLTVTDAKGATAEQTLEVEVTPKPDGGCSSTGSSSGAMLLALLAGVLLSRRRGLLS